MLVRSKSLPYIVSIYLLKFFSFYFLSDEIIYISLIGNEMILDLYVKVSITIKRSNRKYLVINI